VQRFVEFSRVCHPAIVLLCSAGDTDQEDVRGRSIGDDDGRRRQGILRTIRTGKACVLLSQWHASLNPLIGTLKPQSNGPLNNSTVIGTLTIDGWTVTLDTARRILGGCGLQPRPVRSSLYHRSTASEPTSYYSMYVAL